MNAAPSASHLSIPGNDIHQNSTRCPPLNRVPVDFGGQPSQASRLVTSIGAVPPSAVSVPSPHHSVVQRDTQLAPPSDYTDSVQAQKPPVTLSLSHMQMTASQRSFNYEPPTSPVGQDLSQCEHKKQGMFDGAHDFSMMEPTFIDGNKGYIAVTNNFNNISSQFVEKLLKKTIPGAAADSSARHPPPRCHPGTRLAVLERCLYFIANCDGEQKICWVVGAAGVGKSAVMQSVADSPNLPVICHMSVFFAINGRDDGTKTILTLSYQLAAKHAPYRQFIECEVERDPSLLQMSMPVQFERFFVQPFIHCDQLKSAGRVLILIDGLDECNNRNTQLELLRLISDFCIMHPSSPLVWLIASRPERHISSFFARANVMPAYEREEIQVDSAEGRADVERFLRERLEVIKGDSGLFDPHSEWPDKRNFWKLANASGGLFAYADTVIRYIGDLNIGNPVSQLSDVLKVIDNLPMTSIPREEHPMALLDALYARILSNVPAKVILHTRGFVLALASRWDEALAMTPDEAYAAVNQLQSVLRIPRRDTAHLQKLVPFHKSFIDYVSDSSRSNFFLDMLHEAQQLKTEYYRFAYGILRRGPGTGDMISLTWPADEGSTWNGQGTRLSLYKLAFGVVARGLAESYAHGFYHRLHQPVFDECGRHEFIKHGILKQMPLKAVDISTILAYVTLQFRRPVRTKAHTAVNVSTLPNAVKLLSHHATGTVTTPSDPWNSSCEHGRKVNSSNASCKVARPILQILLSQFCSLPWGSAV
ncbi:hypothetical protein AGABI1DRAFT_105346 [Agaricus bisporus var. burnettii JB137-S8]|uniref:Nephrocystin 3-like N-terminal domain-containing protein n=1 Tax=Agaricus bisporus var. burnettii (strain JB137-S8 / ATCC MYA-4627 / FGSC 10392) TaxID=597362 RepID=K5W560_AGABU|nr:uncharacterized protein AGABI1DRAFT_105346 [Agaricus bisporus var. burnettii JB137-S8]EKM81949.1 hypothetical protein AGABI1DRAFT_105346 [Agaricus bisporus var. burnettii JB137-S8]